MIAPLPGDRFPERRVPNPPPPPPLKTLPPPLLIHSCRGDSSPGTPAIGLRERGNDTSRSTGRSGRQNAATRRNMRREERVTAQGPVKEQPPDGMSHGGWGVGALGLEGAMGTGQAHQASSSNRTGCPPLGRLLQVIPSSVVQRGRNVAASTPGVSPQASRGPLPGHSVPSREASALPTNRGLAAPVGGLGPAGRLRCCWAAFPVPAPASEGGPRSSGAAEPKPSRRLGATRPLSAAGCTKALLVAGFTYTR